MTLFKYIFNRFVNGTLFYNNIWTSRGSLIDIYNQQALNTSILHIFHYFIPYFHNDFIPYSTIILSYILPSVYHIYHFNLSHTLLYNFIHIPTSFFPVFTNIYPTFHYNFIPYFTINLFHIPQ